jgi:hypothetical protein
MKDDKKKLEEAKAWVEARAKTGSNFAATYLRLVQQSSPQMQDYFWDIMQQMKSGACAFEEKIKDKEFLKELHDKVNSKKEV